MKTVLLLLIFVLLNQNYVFSLVTDYNVTIWNSQGYRLQQVLDFFLSNPSLNLALVQESGNVASENPGQLIHQNLEFIVADAENAFECFNAGYFEVREYVDQGMRLYIYFFPATPYIRPDLGLTIVSRHQATGILYFVSQHTRRASCESRYLAFINRPVVGLVLGTDNIFLNIHAEPTRRRNEVLTQLRAIRSHMSIHRPHASWTLAGDFNRLPQDVQPSLVQNQERLVQPPQSTHGNDVLDYYIYGSADQNVFAQMDNPSNQATINPTLTGSDHHAVYFSNYITSIQYDRGNLQQILDQACTVRRSKYNDWTNFYDEIYDDKDRIPSSGFMQFQDGSYMQPVVVERDSDIKKSANWYPLDLSLLIGLEAAYSYSVRHKRAIGVSSATHHGLIFMNSKGSPTMTVFLRKDKLLCMTWTHEGWSSPTDCHRHISPAQFSATRTEQSFDRCYNKASESVISENLEALDNNILKSRNLLILQREFSRTMRNYGFFNNDYNTFKDYYNAKWNNTLINDAYGMSGAEFSARWNYGYYFKDGSFSVAFSSKHIQKNDTDNWLFINGNKVSDWDPLLRNIYGMFFFDKFGRPVIFFAALSDYPNCCIYRSHWVYEYRPDNSWVWIENYSEWEPSVLSKNPGALRFVIDKNNIHY
ncbi:uncharacterized protein LOC116654562 [Drosophila ananassae]|uniref:uncharacterized protein LOC116654562 n=1 Tax=Drosophila ananassae TaxID=7217 RepID=UPI001CFFBC77|nr:uncharacterized protein LOC116654562 [Drosophila ananassae]